MKAANTDKTYRMDRKQTDSTTSVKRQPDFVFYEGLWEQFNWDRIITTQFTQRVD